MPGLGEMQIAPGRVQTEKRTGEHFYGVRDGMSAAETCVRRWWVEEGRGPMPGPDIDETATAEVRMNWHRWLAYCPWCSGAQYASVLDHRFFCCDCGNAANGGRWVRTVWPDNVAQIEWVMELLPDPGDRNWRYNDTENWMMRKLG